MLLLQSPCYAMTRLCQRYTAYRHSIKIWPAVCPAVQETMLEPLIGIAVHINILPASAFQSRTRPVTYCVTQLPDTTMIHLRSAPHLDANHHMCSPQPCSFQHMCGPKVNTEAQSACTSRSPEMPLVHLPASSNSRCPLFATMGTT